MGKLNNDYGNFLQIGRHQDNQGLGIKYLLQQKHGESLKRSMMGWSQAEKPGETGIAAALPLYRELTQMPRTSCPPEAMPTYFFSLKCSNPLKLPWSAPRLL